MFFYPSLVRTLPSFAPRIYTFVKGRGERDLPQSQFKGRLNHRKPSDFVEMSGLLGYSRSSGIAEFEYCPPDVRYVCRKGGKIVSTTSGNPTKKTLDLNALFSAKYLIHYHSHPEGDGEISDDDVEGMGALLGLTTFSRFTNGLPHDLFFTIFLPHKDATVWYRTIMATHSPLRRR